MFLNNPLLGVGINQFVLRVDDYWSITGIARFAQPVHNAWLLIATEMGLVGLFGVMTIVLRLIYKGFRTISPTIVALWLFIFLTSLVDHYWLTIQAGNIVLFLTLGFTLATINMNPISHE